MLLILVTALDRHADMQGKHCKIYIKNYYMYEKKCIKICNNLLLYMKFFLQYNNNFKLINDYMQIV